MLIFHFHIVWCVTCVASLMPVLTCFIALPDGTFLMVNGAHQGVAGFGLATDPNFSAVLYDPTQPIGQRFSILNNTIVARLYHSEATVCVCLIRMYCIPTALL